jgi:hypothetical protein
MDYIDDLLRLIELVQSMITRVELSREIGPYAFTLIPAVMGGSVYIRESVLKVDSCINRKCSVLLTLHTPLKILTTRKNTAPRNLNADSAATDHSTTAM